MKKVYVYSHTHWDYEWYFTANETIVQLIYHMDEVIEALESGEVDNYLLDGQLSILDEYIKFMPSKLEKVKKLVEEGKLIIGPWYTQTDELIVSGESIVRNLFYGIKSAKKYGDYMKVGYLPDSFGQTKDLPKILNGFDIKRSVFWRGVSKEDCPYREFKWNGEDGSSVLVYNIKDGYYYGGNLIYSDDIKTVEETIQDGALTDTMLLPVGGDQRYVDLNIKERIDFYNRNSINNFEYIESTCDKFFDELEKKDGMQEVTGEFVNPSNSKIHRSIYSSRYDHKYLNDKIERRMIKILEPLMVMAQNLGINPKCEMIEEIWKKILMNHAHDSACGCNSDKTNDAILARLKEADELSYSACDYIIRKISESLEMKKENELILFNISPKVKNEVVKVQITTKTQGFKIFNEEGKEVKFQTINQKREYAGSIKRTIEEQDENLYFYVTDIKVLDNLNPFSIKRLNIIEVKEVIVTKRSKENKIEDKFYKIFLEEGNLSLINKKTDEKIENFIRIEDSGDDGDTYDYSPPIKDLIQSFSFDNAEIECNKGDLFEEMVLSGQVNIPKNLMDRENKSINIEIPYKLQITLQNKTLIEVKLEIDNKADSHRMRAIINTGVNSETSIADTPFGIIERKNKPSHIEDWRDLKWKEEPSPIYPMLNFTNINDEKSSVTVFAKGIKEFEIIENRKIAITLFRGVGYLGKPDLIRRPGVASGNEFKYIETPKSQLKEKLKFKFAVNINEEFRPSEIKEKYDSYAVCTPYYQIQEINRFTNTLKYFVSHPLRTTIKPIEKLIDCSLLNKISISAIVPINEKEYVIRLVNLGEAVADGGKISVKKAKEYCFVNLNNEAIKEIEKNKSTIDVGSFKKGEIKTIKFIR